MSCKRDPATLVVLTIHHYTGTSQAGGRSRARRAYSLLTVVGQLRPVALCASSPILLVLLKRKLLTSSRLVSYHLPLLPFVRLLRSSALYRFDLQSIIVCVYVSSCTKCACVSLSCSILHYRQHHSVVYYLFQSSVVSCQCSLGVSSSTWPKVCS